MRYEVRAAGQLVKQTDSWNHAINWFRYTLYNSTCDVVVWAIPNDGGDRSVIASCPGIDDEPTQ